MLWWLRLWLQVLTAVAPRVIRYQTPAAVNGMIQGLSSLTEYLEPPIYSWFTAFTTWSESRNIINGALCHPSGEPE